MLAGQKENENKNKRGLSAQLIFEMRYDTCEIYGEIYLLAKIVFRPKFGLDSNFARISREIRFTQVPNDVCNK